MSKATKQPELTNAEIRNWLGRLSLDVYENRQALQNANLMALGSRHRTPPDPKKGPKFARTKR